MKTLNSVLFSAFLTLCAMIFALRDLVLDLYETSPIATWTGLFFLSMGVASAFPKTWVVLTLIGAVIFTAEKLRAKY